MSYPKDLCDYDTKELEDELARRGLLRAREVCDYCGRSASMPTCRYPHRHAGKKTQSPNKE